MVIKRGWRSAFSGIGIAHKQPVLFFQSLGTVDVFNEAVLGLHVTVAEINVHRSLLAMQIFSGNARKGLRQISPSAPELWTKLP
jgi:hypothetical protein